VVHKEMMQSMTPEQSAELEKAVEGAIKTAWSKVEAFAQVAKTLTANETAAQQIVALDA
jgi:hypothetical protein